jgi:hypothetical protein
MNVVRRNKRFQLYIQDARKKESKYLNLYIPKHTSKIWQDRSQISPYVHSAFVGHTLGLSTCELTLLPQAFICFDSVVRRRSVNANYSKTGPQFLILEPFRCFQAVEGKGKVLFGAGARSGKRTDSSVIKRDYTE